MDLVTLLQVVVGNMLIYSTPLILTALGGIFSERSGIVNIGLEGTMVISGALAGLGGVMEGLGTFQNAFASESLPSIGWDGMAVSLLGLNNPIGILFSALVFAILRIGGISMPLLAKIPTEVVSIVVAFIIFFVGANYLMEVIVDKFPQFGKRKG